MGLLTVTAAFAASPTFTKVSFNGTANRDVQWRPHLDYRHATKRDYGRQLEGYRDPIRRDRGAVREPGQSDLRAVNLRQYERRVRNGSITHSDASRAILTLR